jgi:uncharacterized protein
MARGATGIIGAVFTDLRGRPGITGAVNFIFKVNEGRSVFGDYHYKIAQLKRAGDIKEHYAVQTALLNEILSQAQGFNPRFALFRLKDKERELDCVKNLDRARQAVSTWSEIKEGTLIPEASKPPKAATPPWRIYANKFLFASKDLVLIPHLSKPMRDALRENGIKDYDDIVKCGLPKIKEILREPLTMGEATALQTYYTSIAYQNNAPVPRVAGAFPTPAKARNLYFDFEATETFTKNSVSFVYLIGVWDKEKDKFVSFIAKSEPEEETIFKQFADYIDEQGQTALYHWTEYEVKKMRALREKYPAIRQDLEKLLSVCVDLKVIIDKSFYLPAPSLSLKAAAPALGSRWRQSDCGAMDSMVFFTNWLRSGNDALLNKVLTYNEDDCKAMLFIEDYLKNWLNEQKGAHASK